MSELPERLDSFLRVIFKDIFVGFIFYTAVLSVIYDQIPFALLMVHEAHTLYVTYGATRTFKVRSNIFVTFLAGYVTCDVTFAVEIRRLDTVSFGQYQPDGRM